MSRFFHFDGVIHSSSIRHEILGGCVFFLLSSSIPFPLYHYPKNLWNAFKTKKNLIPAVWQRNIWINPHRNVLLDEIYISTAFYVLFRNKKNLPPPQMISTQLKKQNVWMSFAKTWRVIYPMPWVILKPGKVLAWMVLIWETWRRTRTWRDASQERGAGCKVSTFGGLTSPKRPGNRCVAKQKLSFTLPKRTGSHPATFVVTRLDVFAGFEAGRVYRRRQVGLPFREDVKPPSRVKYLAYCLARQWILIFFTWKMRRSAFALSCRGTICLQTAELNSL